MKQPKPEQYHEKKRHTEDQFPYNTYLCTIPDDFTEVPVHWHEEAELIVIQKGSGTVLVDLTHYHVTAGDIIIVLPEHLHAIREISGQKMEYENIIFRPVLFSSDNHEVCVEKFLYPLFSGHIHTVFHIHPRLSYYPKIHDLIRTMDQLCSKKPAGYQLALKGSLFLFMFQLLSLDEKKELSNIQQRSLDKLKFIITFTNEHLEESISIRQIASACYFSESHFMKFFKTHMGISYIHYLNDVRLAHARNLLVSSNLSILEIAQKSGFENASYFNRKFKDKYGITPRQAR